MKPEKTNTEFLREVISKTLASNSENYDEINEFIDAIESEVVDYKDVITSLEQQLNSKDSEIGELALELENRPYGYTTIDCGIGTIEYKTDNLKLQLLMEEFKERQEYPMVK